MTFLVPAHPLLVNWVVWRVQWDVKPYNTYTSPGLSWKGAVKRLFLLLLLLLLLHHLNKVSVWTECKWWTAHVSDCQLWLRLHLLSTQSVSSCDQEISNYQLYILSFSGACLVWFWCDPVCHVTSAFDLSIQNRFKLHLTRTTFLPICGFPGSSFSS